MENFKDIWKSITYENGYGELIDTIKAKYEENKNKNGNGIGTLLFRDRQAFYSSGDRSAYEKVYFGRRHYLDSAALLALIYPKNTEYLLDAEDAIMAICEEFSWVLPAHTDGSIQQNRDRIDLFSAETALELTEIMYFLGDRLSPILKDLIVENVTQRVFDAFDRYSQGWIHNKSNWASVCCGSVAGAMMYLDPERFEKNLPTFLTAMESFLESYTDDGTCLEGVSYWHYGFSAFAWFADMLYRYTDGKKDLFDNKKVKNCAKYMQRNFLVGDTTVSFSDGSMKGKSGYGIQYFLHDRYPDTVTLLPKKYLNMTGNSFWLNMSRSLFYYRPDKSVEEIEFRDYYMPDAGQYVSSRKKFSFAIKAGHNGEPHNHNDVGSFIISSQNGQELCDLGAGLYTRQYFSPEHRYSILCNRSKGHSVPIINGCEQQTGAEFKSTMSMENGCITIDFADAYGIEALKRLTRQTTVNSDGIVLNDTFEGNVKVTERFVSLVKPKTDMGCVVLDKVRIRFSSILQPKVTEETHQIHVAGNGITVYCIDFYIPSDTTEAEFVFEIE